MICKKCGKELEEGFVFCPYCGKQLVGTFPSKKKRGNGTGSVTKVGTNNYKAIVVLGYKDEDKTKPIRRTKSGFRTRLEALNYIPTLYSTPSASASRSLKQLYEEWDKALQVTTRTRASYKCMFKWLQPLWNHNVDTLGVQDFQNLVDGLPITPTRKSLLRTVIRSMWEFAIPREYVKNLNVGKYIVITDRQTALPKQGFSDQDLEAIRNGVGKVNYSDYILAMCYTGFRVSEFLDLKHDAYDFENKTVRGGGKTKAGTNRLVTISPKVADIFDRRYKTGSATLFAELETGEEMTDKMFRYQFDKCLRYLNIANPVNERGQCSYTPHSCRRTFATLMKRVKGADKDKLELIGHTTNEMLQYYQDISLEDLKKITDNI